MGIQRAYQKCRDNGVRMTPLRREVLSIILESHTALSAMEILKKSGKDHPPTIYRTLDFFVEQGIIHHIKSNNSYIACIHCDGNRPILLICSKCNNVKERPVNDPSMVLSDDVLNWIGGDFDLQKNVIELIGICQICRAEPN